jgi:hypothetical protein
MSTTPGHGLGRAQINLPDLRMGMRRAEKIGMGLPGTIDVVGIIALAGDETEIFLALDGCTDTGRAHGVPSQGMDRTTIQAVLLIAAVIPPDRLRYLP